MKLPPKPAWRTILRPGSRIYIGSGAACPLQLIQDMLQEKTLLNDLEILQSRTLGPSPWAEEPYRGLIRVNAFFLDPELSAAADGGQGEYTPAHYSGIPALFDERVIRVNAVLIMVSPPDKYGYCSLGPSVDLTPSALRNADLIVAQINPECPRTSAFIHLSKIHYALEAAAPLPELDPIELTAASTRIGEYCAQLINDGDTLQLGVGPMGTAVARALKQHRELGIHSESFGESLRELFEAGVIDNSRKSLLPGRAIAASALGSKNLYSFLHDNPHIDLRPTEFVNDPITIARNHNMVSINSALQVDLSGQVVVDSLQEKFHSGLGSQVDFARGAVMSRGGRPIVALPSTAIDMEGVRYSRIVPEIPHGAGVGLNRADVDHVVTEHGVASLRGRTVQERVLELIQIAHPDFRESLMKAARARHLVPAYVQLPPPYAESDQNIQIRRVRLRDGRDYILRPLNPADDRRLQEFFYSHTEETINRRYGFTITRMSRERAFELVGIDQNRDLALAIIELQGPRQVIHAVGRYYLDPSGRSGEMAFVVRERKRRLGSAHQLLTRMCEIAANRGLTFLWAQVDSNNLPMLNLFRKLGSVHRPGTDSGSIRVELPLRPPPGRASKEKK